MISLPFFALLISALMKSTDQIEKKSRTILAFVVKDKNGKEVPLRECEGNVLLFVTVAFECSYTPQYESLEQLFRTRKQKEFAILGFPANNFGKQEPGTNDETRAFCQRTCKVTLDMFLTMSVAEGDQPPLCQFLTSPETDPKCVGDVTWSLQKYLIR